MDSFASVFIDVDGTLFDTFKKEDKRIIRKMFGSNPFIIVIDAILWFINSFDFIPNSFKILKLRFYIYMIFSFKSYKYIITTYEEEYKKSLKQCLKMIDESKLKKLHLKYDLHVITNNPYSLDICIDFFNHAVFCKNNGQRLRNVSNIITEKNSKENFMIGNNFADDIFLAKKLGISSCYIGKSIIRKMYGADNYFTSFDEVVDFLLERE